MSSHCRQKIEEVNDDVLARGGVGTQRNEGFESVPCLAGFCLANFEALIHWPTNHTIRHTTPAPLDDAAENDGLGESQLLLQVGAAILLVAFCVGFEEVSNEAAGTTRVRSGSKGEEWEGG